jgi:hypothetical protein
MDFRLMELVQNCGESQAMVSAVVNPRGSTARELDILCRLPVHLEIV